MAPSHRTRGLFRVSAIVPDIALHRLLLMLADIKAANVETIPVTSEPKATRAHGGARRGRNGEPPLKTKITAAFQPGAIMDAGAIAEVIGEHRHSIGVALANMAKDGTVERVSQGKYRLTGTKSIDTDALAKLQKGRAALTNGGAPHKGKRARGIGDVIRGLFEAAPERKLHRQQIKDAIAAHGGSPRSFDGVMSRLKAKSVGDGVWQMRGSK